MTVCDFDEENKCAVKAKFEVGTKVMFQPTVGNGVFIEGKECILMNEGAVKATFNTKPKIVLAK